MEDWETTRMRRYGESKTTRIMMATVPHVTFGSGLRKFQADVFLFDSVYNGYTGISPGFKAAGAWPWPPSHFLASIHLHLFCAFKACYGEIFNSTPTSLRIFISFRVFCRNCAFCRQSGNTPVVLSFTPRQAEPCAVAFRTEAPADSNIFRMRSLQQNELPLWST